MLSALLLLPLSSAGSRHSPDIVDARGDVQFSPVILNVASPEIDILSAWVDFSGGEVVFAWQLQDLTHRLVEDESLTYALTFRGDQYEHAAATAMLLRGTWYFRFHGDPHVGPSVLVSGSGSVDAATGVVEARFPATLIEADLVDVVASSIVALPTSPGSYSGGGTVWLRDWAPDDLEGPTVAAP